MAIAKRYVFLLATSARLTIAQSQGTVSVALEPVAGSKSPRLFIHNDTTMTLTAYLLVSTIPEVGGHGAVSSEMHDVALGTWQPLLAGEKRQISTPSFALNEEADPTKMLYLLQAEVFGDGTVGGDPEWSSEILAVRRASFQALTNVIRDLKDAPRSSVDDLLRFMDASRLRQRDPIDSINQADHQARARLANESGGVQVGHEQTRGIKAANIRVDQDNQITMKIESYYARVKGLVSPGTTANDASLNTTLDDRVNASIEVLNNMLHRLTIAAPPLGLDSQ